VRAIARQYLGRIEATLRERRKTLVVDDEALEAIVRDGHSLAYGARFLKRVIDDKIKLPISEHWSEATQFHVRLVDGAVKVDAVGPRLVAVADNDLAYGT
jgi:ATP-dependent Clp protease ATP-binding subunit ClpA